MSLSRYDTPTRTRAAPSPPRAAFSARRNAAASSRTRPSPSPYRCASPDSALRQARMELERAHVVLRRGDVHLLGGEREPAVVVGAGTLAGRDPGAHEHGVEVAARQGVALRPDVLDCAREVAPGELARVIRRAESGLDADQEASAPAAKRQRRKPILLQCASGSTPMGAIWFRRRYRSRRCMPRG